ncbi:hypothetical protein EDB92DRAFT_1887814 [Lactarius akahatsu]|uniref:Uncharacterized protein n=1 Tax=Lactarius akahatsu TaxID=416441 RepID=A0AAD4LA38_9AGAM|nr:hypothetical protein EDB92DRAFT_1887814 [Lactarius akahatsu]
MHQIAFNNRCSSKVPSPGQRAIAIDAIVDVIFSFSTPRAIISLSRTCRAAQPIAASYFRVAYNPEHFLQQFFPNLTDVRAFRSLQAETGVVAFGKAVRNFLARAPLTDTEMNLFVDEPYAPQVDRFLTRAGYDMEAHGQELVFSKKGDDEEVISKIVLRVGPPESFETLDKPRDFPREFTDVFTLDGAYSLFPGQYDESTGDPILVAPSVPPQQSTSKCRSFSDSSSWVVTFDKTNVLLPQLAFGTSTPLRDPLYTSSSILVWPQTERCGPVIRLRSIVLRGIVLRSRLLRLAHVIQFVQQFLTRLVLAYPERANSYFDTEVTQFLRIVFERADIRDGLASYSTAWAIMKVCSPSSRDLCWDLHNRIVELTRKWSLYRPIPQVQVCSGHT